MVFLAVFVRNLAILVSNGVWFLYSGQSDLELGMLLLEEATFSLLSISHQ